MADFVVSKKDFLWNNVCRLTSADDALLEVHTKHYPVKEGERIHFHLAHKLAPQVLERCAYVMNGQFVSKSSGKLCYSFGGLLLMLPYADGATHSKTLTKHVVLGLEAAC